MIRAADSPSPLIDRCADYRIGGISISITSELDEVLGDVAALYRGYPQGGTHANGTIRMEVRKVKGRRLRRPRYRIAGDGEEIGRERQRDEVLPFLEWGINWRVIATRSEYLQLHSAALVHRGAGCIFAGASGCGKSTLAAALLSRGWGYLGDELALVYPASLSLQPFPKALCIKAGSFGLVRRLNMPFAGRRHHVKGFKGHVGYINPLDVRAHPLGDPAPVRFVIFPKYTEGCKPRLYPVSRARGAFGLARCALNSNMIGLQAFSILSDLVRGAECYGLESGPIDGACDLIESLF